MQHVCLIRQSIYPYDLLVRREAETLQQAGYDVHIICLQRLPDDPIQQMEEVINGVQVHRIPLVRKKTSNARYAFEYLSFALLAALKVTRLHGKQHFDVVQVNSMPDLLVFAAFIPKLLGAKVFSMMYEPTPELWEDLRRSRPPFVLALVEQMALAFADRTFTVTQQLKETYVSRGAKPEKIHVVLNAPDESFLSASFTPPEKDTQYFTVICHGAIEERYGLDTLLDAAALVRSDIPNLRVRILGKGTYVETLLAKREQLGLEDCVEYLGYVPLETMLRELRAADVGVVAQKSSPYSNLVHTGKMYEYIALGKPVLASRLRSVAAYFDDNALAFFESNDPHSLAAGLLDLYQHTERRKLLVRNAAALYERYRWEQQKDVYLSVYRKFVHPVVAIQPSHGEAR